MSTYWVFKPRDTNDTNHDTTNDSSKTKENKLGGCVAFVVTAVNWSVPNCIWMGTRSCKTIFLHHSETKNDHYQAQCYCSSMSTYSFNSFLSAVSFWIIFFLSLSSSIKLSILFWSCLISVRAISISLPKIGKKLLKNLKYAKLHSD